MQKKKTSSGLSLRYKSAFVLPLLFALPLIQQLDDGVLHLFGCIAARKIFPQGVVFDDHFVQLVLFLFSHDRKGNVIREVTFLRQLFEPLCLGKGWSILGVVHAVAAALLSLTSNKYIILLIMNVILLVSGTFMDVTPAILIFTPLFLPICQSFGMSTIQFGLILVYNLCIGNITPPVGNALFVGIKVGRTSLSKVMPYMLMYYVAIIGGLLLVTFIPAVSTALPQAMGLM